MSTGGSVIRISVADVPKYSRTAGGVIVMRMTDGAKVLGFSAATSSDGDDSPATDSDIIVSKTESSDELLSEIEMDNG